MNAALLNNDPQQDREIRKLMAARTALQAAPVKGLNPNLARIIRPQAVTRWLLNSTAIMTPDYIETILRGALGGSPTQQWELFDLMEDTWPRLAKNLAEIKRAVLGLDWELEPWAEEEIAPTDTAIERQRLVSSALWRMRPRPEADENNFEGTITDILDAWGKGTSVLEILWEKRPAGMLGDIIAPRATAWVHPGNYAWTQDGWLGLTQTAQRVGYQSEQTVTPFPPDKFIIAISKAKTGHPLSSALLRPLAFWWCAANFTAEWFLNLAQIFGLPIRWATYDPNIPGLVDNVADMLENMGSAAWGAFPAGTTIELKEAGKAGQDNPQVALLERADRNCDILILGQTLTTDSPSSGGGTRAQGEVHLTVRDQVIAAAANFAAGVINGQLIPAILRLNYGNDLEAPEICAEPKEQEDEKANAERDQILLQQGVEMPKAWFYKRHDIPLPQANEEVIAGKPAPDPLAGFGGRDGTPMPAAGEAMNARHATLHASDAATDKIINHALENLTGVEARWLGAVKPFFHQLIAAAQSRNVSDADFAALLGRAQKEMPELFAKLQPQHLEKALNDSMSAAFVNGAVRGALQRQPQPA